MSQQPPNLPPSSALAELKAIRQELERLRNDLNTLRRGLSYKVAKGVFLGSIGLTTAMFLLYILVTAMNMRSRYR